MNLNPMAVMEWREMKSNDHYWGLSQNEDQPLNRPRKIQSPTNFSLSCDLNSKDFDQLKFVEPPRAHPSFNAIAPLEFCSEHHFLDLRSLYFPYNA